MKKQVDVYVKWYHWLWIWILKTDSVEDVSIKKTYKMITTMYYKQAFGKVYITKTTYKQYKVPNARQIRKGIK